MLWLQFVAKKLDRRISDLGATAVVERGLGDDQHPSGYDYITIEKDLGFVSTMNSLCFLIF